MILNRFFKTTLGLQAEVVIANALDTSNSSAPQATYEAFITTATANHMAAYFEDDHTLVGSGDIVDPDNALRFVFYAWKQADGTTMRTTSIPCAGYKATLAAHSAGTAGIIDVTLGGTVSAGQTIWLTVIETTGTILPYPRYQYAVVSSGNTSTDATAMRAAINAETNEKIVTASGSTNHVIVTGDYKTRTFKVTTFLETTTTAATDASAFTQSVTATTAAPIGVYADVKELETYLREQNGAVLYTNGGVNPDEFGQPATNVSSSVNYGYVFIRAYKTEKGIVRNYDQFVYIVIATVDADAATIAAY